MRISPELSAEITITQVKELYGFDMPVVELDRNLLEIS